MRGSRLVLTIAGLAVLAVLAVVAVAIGTDDDGDGGGSTSGGPTATTADVETSLTDEEAAGLLLPPVSALGPDWIDTLRDDEPSEATVEAGDACPSGPIPEGWLLRGEQRRRRGEDIVETLSVTAGVVAPGAEPADLDDPVVVQCLLDGLRNQVPDTSTVAAVDGPALGPPPAGAVVAHQRFEVTGADGSGGTFDFVLVRRGRTVSLGLLVGVGSAATTPLTDLVVALDRPLDAVVARVD